MRENGVLETSNRADGVFPFRLLAKAGFVIEAAEDGGISSGFQGSQQRIGSPANDHRRKAAFQSCVCDRRHVIVGVLKPAGRRSECYCIP